MWLNYWLNNWFLKWLNTETDLLMMSFPSFCIVSYISRSSADRVTVSTNTSLVGNWISGFPITICVFNRRRAIIPSRPWILLKKTMRKNAIKNAIKIPPIYDFTRQFINEFITLTRFNHSPWTEHQVIIHHYAPDSPHQSFNPSFNHTIIQLLPLKQSITLSSNQLIR